MHKSHRRPVTRPLAVAVVLSALPLQLRGQGLPHSSLPTRDNAIYHLAAALSRIATHEFPVRLNEITRAYFERAAAAMRPALAVDVRRVLGTPPDAAAAARLSAQSPFFNAQLRTTCVATRLEAGHADNALPQTARPS